MQTKVIVLVTDRDDAKHGEISIIDSMGKAERLVETLMEAGFERERIRVFSGGELELQVTHRPVVSLVKPMGSVAEVRREESEAGEESLAKEEESEAKELEGALEEGAPSAHGGFRFSSLFRSDESPG